MGSSYEYHLPVARHPGWVLSTSRWLPALSLVALATCLPFFARSEIVSAPQDERGIPPVDRHAPFTPKVISLLSRLTVDERISLVHGAYNPDPASVGQVGYLPGVPRLGIPVRRDADALGLEVIADATAPPARLGLGSTFDRQAVQAWGQIEGNEGQRLASI